MTSRPQCYVIAACTAAATFCASFFWAPTAAAEPIVALESLLLRPYSEVRAQLLSGSWAPRIEELVYIPPGDPKIVPTSAMRQTFTVVDTCFTKRITPMGIYLLLASPESVEKVGADNFRATYGQLVPKYRPGCDPDVQQIDLGRPPF
ncbi:hypothetical protein [Mycobacteroides immunogenum]|uniref:Uncharacterized protein n=1 Tax=Mycobacteroides immunogenum TaxID=83262 RepID=A0A7V8RW83_9MYCO|nr:hypothetical protein [Mycobacteroides immunogenum]AMT71755.1 hypothetical protein ABG82_17095 [Mycobacteroides immunogenum]ANO04877.1 hypothetical protein BAB75_17365 [Mycobacteroides immunogenum]KIU39015.1 hypothetical protein TL11_19145 [Mycobacteroides immunogenum]KPG04384.1 hypothetical protein AN910_25045 [Mycobacteroides immunogenum]KPG07234.1 hypothetical protein AN909_17600 [Mycobacteroides immunogenum]